MASFVLPGSPSLAAGLPTVAASASARSKRSGRRRVKQVGAKNPKTSPGRVVKLAVNVDSVKRRMFLPSTSNGTDTSVDVQSPGGFQTPPPVRTATTPTSDMEPSRRRRRRRNRPRQLAPGTNKARQSAVKVKLKHDGSATGAPCTPEGKSTRRRRRRPCKSRGAADGSPAQCRSQGEVASSPSSPGSFTSDNIVGSPTPAPDTPYSHVRCCEDLRSKNRVRKELWQLLTGQVDCKEESETAQQKDAEQEKQTIVGGSTGPETPVAPPRRPPGTPPRSGRTLVQQHGNASVRPHRRAGSRHRSRRSRRPGGESQEQGSGERVRKSGDEENSGWQQSSKAPATPSSPKFSPMSPIPHSSPSPSPLQAREPLSPIGSNSLNTSTVRMSRGRRGGELERRGVSDTHLIKTPPHRNKMYKRHAELESGGSSTSSENSPPVPATPEHLNSSPELTTGSLSEVSPGSPRRNNRSALSSPSKSTDSRRGRRRRTGRQRSRSRSRDAGTPPATTSSNIQSPSEPVLPDQSPHYSHVRCCQGLRQSLSVARDPEQQGSTTAPEVNASNSLPAAFTGSVAVPTEAEIVLVAGRMKPNPSVAVQFRDPQLPAGLLRCLDVGLPLSAKDPKVPTSRFVKSEVESLIALLHREAPIFRCVAPHQLRRVLTCIAVEFVKITGGGSSPTSVTAAC